MTAEKYRQYSSKFIKTRNWFVAKPDVGSRTGVSFEDGSNDR